MPTIGYKELSNQLKRMSRSVGGKALRSAAMTATLPALKEAQSSAPVGNPPYQYEGREVDPYPVKTYKGRLRTPGFTSRSIARKSKLSRDNTHVRVMLGVRPEAFYAINFYEFGTSRQPAQPWLEPSFRRSIPAVDTRFREQLKLRIDKAAK
jgi:HK97 gp10 family phage protein